MQAIKDSGAGTIFSFVNAGRVNTLVNAVAGSGLSKAGVKLIGPGDMAFDDELAKMSPNVAGMITAGVYYAGNPSPANQKFMSAWKKEYGNDALPSALAVAGWDGMAAIYALVRATNGKFDADTAMKFLSNWKAPDSPRGPFVIDPETRDIVQTLYMNRAEMVNGKPTNVNIAKVDGVKDPWKRLNPK
jgi:branched-chain amino acid transport system substrate-binding protein